MSHWIKDYNNNLGLFFLISFFIPLILHSYGSFVLTLLWVIMSYLQGVFYHSMSWPMSFMKLKSLASCLNIVPGNVFCMPHRLRISRTMLCNTFKLFHFNSTYSHSAILPKTIITIFIFHLSGKLSKQLLFLKMVMSFAAYSLLPKMSFICNHCIR